jgi:hypothetical protein
VLGSLPLFLSPNIVPGYDASSHVAKTAFLMYSLAHGNLSGWSQFWYSGFQMLYTYSPLTYIVGALLGWPFGSALAGMQLTIALSFAISGLGVYVLATDVGIPSYWSVFAALLYSVASPHILMVFYQGSLTYALAFAVIPWLMFAVRLALRTNALASIATLGTLIGLLVISNESTAYVLCFPLLTYLVVSVPKTKLFRSILTIAASLSLGVLVSAFWLIPYLQIDLSKQLNLFTESASGAYSSSNVIHWYSFFIPNLGNAMTGDVGWILVLPALASIVFLKRREEFALYGGAVVALLMTIGASVSPLFYKIPLVLALQFAWRFLIADVLFAAPLAVIFFWRASERGLRYRVSRGRARKIIIASLLLLLIASDETLSVGAVASGFPLSAGVSPSSPAQSQALSYLADQPGYFRVMVIDRYFESFPQFTLKGSIDGWYDQATTVAYRNFTYNLYYCGASDRVLEGLRLLAVRYVMIDSAYGGDAASALSAYNSSTSPFGTAVFRNSEVTIYQVPDSQLVYVTASIPNLGLGMSQDVNCGSTIPSAPLSQLGYSISDMNWGESSISLDLKVNESAYALVSNSYATGWIATDNGSKMQIVVSPPGLPVLRLAPGMNHIVLSYQTPASYGYSSDLSLGTVIGLVVLCLGRASTRKSDRHQSV